MEGKGMRLFGLNILTDEQLAVLEIEKQLTEQLKLAANRYQQEREREWSAGANVISNAYAEWEYKNRGGLV